MRSPFPFRPAIEPGPRTRTTRGGRAVSWIDRADRAAAAVDQMAGEVAVHRLRGGELPGFADPVAAAELGSPVEPLALFVRQPLTLSDEDGRERVEGVLEVLDRAAGELPLDLLNGREAQCDASFRQAFEREEGVPFTPSNFRKARLGRLDQADAMVVVRTAVSESGSFEVAYNLYGGRGVPMFFAIWRGAPIRTTLLRELDELADVTYVEFDDPAELEAPMAAFLERVAAERELSGASRPRAPRPTAQAPRPLARAPRS